MLVKDIEPERQSFNLDSSLCYGSPDTRNVVVRDSSVLSLIVDEPCLKACEYLYDCNVLTVNSSANKNNRDYGFITIDYESLSEENRKAYQELLKDGFILEKSLEKRNGRILFNIYVPITDSTTVEEFSSKMLGIVSIFQHQDILYGDITDKLRDDVDLVLQNGSSIDVTGTVNAVEVIYDGISKGIIKPSDNGDVEIDGKLYSFDDFIDYILKNTDYASRYYYDKKDNRYWLHEDLYRKHLAWLSSPKVVSKILPNNIDIDMLIETIEKRMNISKHEYGTSDCFDLGDFVLLRYGCNKFRSNARPEAEFDMDVINKAVLLGANTPRHYVVKRFVVGAKNYCYVIQDKAKGKPCEELTVEEIKAIPQAHYDKLADDLHLLKKCRVDPKLHNYYYDKETGFWIIDLMPGFAYRFGTELKDESICVYMPHFSVRGDIFFTADEGEIDDIEWAKQNKANEYLNERLAKEESKGWNVYGKR